MRRPFFWKARKAWYVKTDDRRNVLRHEDEDQALIHDHKTKDKTGRPLIIYLSPCLVALTKVAAARRTSGPLFLNSLGQPWTINAIRCRMKELRRKLDLPAGTVAYAYRHTYATTALMDGTDLATVAELLGHTDLKMISQHYGHLDLKKDHLKAAAANIRFFGNFSV